MLCSNVFVRWYSYFMFVSNQLAISQCSFILGRNKKVFSVFFLLLLLVFILFPSFLPCNFHIRCLMFFTIFTHRFCYSEKLTNIKTDNIIINKYPIRMNIQEKYRKKKRTLIRYRRHHRRRHCCRQHLHHEEILLYIQYKSTET